jgi:hypothetical protein
MNRMRSIARLAAIGWMGVGLGLGLGLSPDAGAQQEKPKSDPAAKPKLGYKDTPMLPGGKWHVHDGDRPMPPVISPGTSSTQEAPGKPPSDAIVLFDGTDLSKWHGKGGKPAAWKVEGGVMTIPGRGEPGSGTITTNDEFGSCQLHVEWATPDPPKGRDQGRGNSGIEIFGRYEIQVLDSYDNLTYPDGQAGAIYGQYPPLVNASRKPGEWQTYDIIFDAPRFASDGTLEAPAHVTLLHNGVLVHNHTPVLGPVAFRAMPKYTPHGPKGPINLQDHGNPVKYRNIWIRELKIYDQ